MSYGSRPTVWPQKIKKTDADTSALIIEEMFEEGQHQSELVFV